MVVVVWCGCWLLVVGCWLLVVGCWLLVVGCWLLVVGCWLLFRTRVNGGQCVCPQRNLRLIGMQPVAEHLGVRLRATPPPPRTHSCESSRAEKTILRQRRTNDKGLVEVMSTPKPRLKPTESQLQDPSTLHVKCGRNVQSTQTDADMYPLSNWALRAKIPWVPFSVQPGSAHGVEELKQRHLHCHLLRTAGTSHCMFSGTSTTNPLRPRHQSLHNNRRVNNLTQDLHLNGLPQCRNR